MEQLTPEFVAARRFDRSIRPRAPRRQAEKEPSFRSDGDCVLETQPPSPLIALRVTLELMWTSLTLQLPVRDLAESQRYFREVLGFEVAWTRGDHFSAVQAGKTEIFLCQAEQVPSATICVLVDDAESLFAVYRERGARIVETLATKPWGVREFTGEDPNGHLFRIGHSIR